MFYGVLGMSNSVVMVCSTLVLRSVLQWYLVLSYSGAYRSSREVKVFGMPEVFSMCCPCTRKLFVMKFKVVVGLCSKGTNRLQ